MRCRLYRLILIAAIMATRSRAVAAEFGNLGFEDANVPLTGEMSFSEPASVLFPSWTVYLGDMVVPSGSLNTYLTAGAGAALFASDVPRPQVLEGTKSCYLASWLTDAPIFLQQSGDVPANSRSLRFRARNTAFASLPLAPGPFFLRMDGQPVPILTIAGASGDLTLAADITSWAGAPAELRLGVFGYGVPGQLGWAYFDSIEFSPLPVPEPGIAGIVSIGVAALGRHSTRRDGHFRGSN